MAILANERMDQVVTSASCAVRASDPSTVVAREYDDGLDFPPAAHPGRELFTLSLFALVIATFVVWGGWRLISLILTSLL